MNKSIHSPQQKVLQDLLRQVRTEADLLQGDLARRLDISQSIISRWESGERRVDLPELLQICEACGITLEEFARRFEATIRSLN